MVGHARLRLRAASASLLRARILSPSAVPWSYVSTLLQRGSVSRLTGTWTIHTRHSPSKDSVTTKAYLELLRTRISSVGAPEDLESVLQTVDDVPAPGLEVDGWKAVIEALLSRKDRHLLRLLFESPSFQPWIGHMNLGSRLCSRLLHLMFLSRDSHPTPSEVQELVEQFKSRGGVVTHFVRRIVTEDFLRLGVSIPASLAQALSNNASTTPSPTSYVNHARFLRQEQGLDMRETLSQILPSVRAGSLDPRLLPVLMFCDVYEVEDVEWMAAQLNMRPDPSAWSQAVHNALRCTPGTSAAVAVYHYARTQGASITSLATVRLLRRLTGDGDYRIPHPDELKVAIELLWRQIWTSPREERGHISPVGVLTALFACPAMPQRWTTISEILAFFRSNRLPLYPAAHPEFLAVFEALYRSRSHAVAFDAIRHDLLPRDLHSSVYLAVHMRFDDALVPSYEEYRTLLGRLESLGVVIDDNFLMVYIEAVFHNITRVTLRWELEWLDARGSSIEVHLDLAAHNLRQLEAGILRERPQLSTASVRVSLLSAYAQAGKHDVSHLLDDIFARETVSDPVLRRALRSATNLKWVRRMWSSYLTSCPEPSASAWAAYAECLCRHGARKDAFEVIRDRLGDGSPLRKPAILLFAMSPQHELEYYARALPQTWGNARTDEELASFRAHRNNNGSRLRPQTYDFTL